MAGVRTCVNLASNQAEERIVSRNSTKTVSAGGITYTTEIIGRGGRASTNMLDSAVTEDSPAFGYRCTGEVRTHTLIRSITAKIFAICQRMNGRTQSVGFNRNDRRGHRCRNLGPSLFHIKTILEIPTDGGIHITIFEHVAIMQCGGRTSTGADAVEVGPPEIVTYSGINGGETQCIAVVKHKVEIAAIGRSAL